MSSCRATNANDEASPFWGTDVPTCTYSGCMFYDGKRCELMGFKPKEICEPVVQAMADLLTEADQ